MPLHVHILIFDFIFLCPPHFFFFFFFFSIGIIKRKLKPAKFKPIEFAKEAQKKFIDVNTALQKNDK